MKPANFEYHRPTSIEGVVSTLAEHGADAKVLAGGQSLIPIMNMRLAAPRHLVDINRVEGLDAVSVTDEHVEIGALARQHRVERAAEVVDACPLVPQALRHVAHRAIRSRGTVVGSIVHADPAAELPAVLCLLDGVAVARGPRGVREVPAAELYSGYYETTLAADELVTSVRFRRLRDEEGSAFVELARRSGDFAICGVAAIASNGDARVALTGVDVTPRVFDVGAGVAEDGGELDRLVAGLDPQTDVHASVEYRRHLAKALIQRAATEASERAIAALRRNSRRR